MHFTSLQSNRPLLGRAIGFLQLLFVSNANGMEIFYSGFENSSRQTISSGTGHSCAIGRQGALFCWGLNDFGQIGDGTTENRLNPTQVTAIGLGVKEVSVGAKHTCALTSAGGVKCWGANESILFGPHGQLGNGTTKDSPLPVDVLGLTSGVMSIGVGSFHSCAIQANGSAYCWGANFSGQLGDGTLVDRSIPVAVVDLAGAKLVRGGGGHTCALTTGGSVRCWGYNGDGAVGDGTTTNRQVPTQVSGLASGVADLAVLFYHSCALKQTGALVCWGDNAFGEIGDGTNTDRPVPTNPSGLNTGVLAIGSGSNAAHSCATSGGIVYCWGLNDNAQIDNSRVNRVKPIAIASAPTTASELSTGIMHACSRTTNDQLWCWGNNFSGQLGDGTGIGYLWPQVGVFGTYRGPVQVLLP